MKKMIQSLAVVLMLASGIVASASQDVQIYTTDNSKGKITTASIEKAFVDAGFSISDNRDLNLAFKSKFQAINQKMYNLFYLHKKDLFLELVKVSPKAALFAPLSMSIYMEKGSNDISIASLTLEGMAKITAISAKNKHMIEYSRLIKETLAKALPNGHFEKLVHKPLKAKGDLVIAFTAEMEAQGEDIEEELEGIQTELEGSLETVGFIIAGFNKLGEDFAEAGYKKYDFFDSYSICKLSVIFEVSKKYPEAGAFAPCTFYMYREKGSDEIKMEYPSVNNWISSLAMDDAASIKELKDAEKLIVDVVNEVTE